MIVTAALCWWNERPEDLARCVTAAANVADRIVALDGAYRRYPGATPRSPFAQVVAIREAAEAAGLECLVLQPDRLWAGQVEKRTHLLNLAAVGSDWIATLDTDHIVHTDRAAVRSELHGIAEDVVEVVFRTPLNPGRSLERSAPGIWHREQTTVSPLIPQLYRALTDLRVERFHWWYSAVKDGRRVWLWVGAQNQDYARMPHARLTTPYEIEHRCLFRTERQILASRAFLNDRDMVVDLTGQEDDQPGLPAPVWDYERLPA